CSSSPANSNGIYDPCAGNQGSTPCPNPRNRFSVNGVNDIIPADKIDPIGQAILNLYPLPNISDAVFPDPNWRQVIIGTDPGWQFDVKLDHQVTSNHRIGGSYSRHHDSYTAPTLMPTADVDDPVLSLVTQCCLDSRFDHTLFSYSSALQWVRGAQSIKFGGEQRIFFTNFWQPDNPTGIFNFSRDVTTSQPNNGL